jgi:hypothetical protein
VAEACCSKHISRARPLTLQVSTRIPPEALRARMMISDMVLSPLELHSTVYFLGDNGNYILSYGGEGE